MRILALDLGTTTGWAYSETPSPYNRGKFFLAPSRHEDAGMRWIKLKNCLNVFINAELVVYEEVSFTQRGSAAIVYGGLVATLQAWCKEHNIHYTGVPVGTIKKHATGKGNAGKQAMIDAANKKFTFLQEPLGEKDHDIADALWLLDWAIQEYGKDGK
jgi:Holliday junction resolvasome RuvABC endonuclease subunit